ncbi:MobV family relaxase [Hymenobacter lucidus]|uniref:Plasmid recombination protein n=1 Tax=Hymenobacter lucidus TaxID=2880930 RepID=A0ABS8AZ98_9BACT|nr:MobV family relaxase [Hymenobacter lucidus]MCB2411136.1 plasmid recombination protein [Hymenobacter lucidus]
MAYAILRISKLTSREMATSATLHNYRGQDTPNADPTQFSRNQELINHEQLNYWDLASERIAELQLPRLRKDAVRAVEVLLTASPEAFPRDANGQAIDRRDTTWLRDNVAFLQDKFGARNVISCTLHQDEITPHIHAVVVPITQQQRQKDGQPIGPKERLSCRDVFSPASLRQLQTDYAKAMAVHGLERGVMYSTAIHEDVRRHYGAQKTTQQELAQTASPLKHEPFELTPMKLKDHVSPQAYLEREQARMNEHLARQVAAVNAKLTQVAVVATANTLDHDRARVLEKQLATSKKAEMQAAVALYQKTQALEEKSAALATVQQQYQQLIIRTAQGESLSPKLREWAAQQQEQSRKRAENVVAVLLQGSVSGAQQVDEVLRKNGYTVHKTDQQQFLVREQRTQIQFPLAALQPDGKELHEQLQWAIERTRQRQEQQRRQELAQQPGSLHGIITARDAEQAGRIQADLEKAGANVWSVEPLPTKRVIVQVSYRFDWDTIGQINSVLSKVKRSVETELQESPKDYSTRTTAANTLEREKNRDRTKEHGLER